MTERELLADIVRRVDTVDIARRMVRIFRAEMAAYRRLPDGALNGQILEMSRRNVDLFFSSVLEDRELDDRELEPFRSSARNRAAEGLPLADLLHAYRIGGRMGWQALVDAATPEEQTALLPSVDRLMEHVDRVSDAVTETYDDWAERLASEDERRVRSLLDALTGEAPLDADLAAVAEAEGLPVLDEYAPFVIALPGAPEHFVAQHAAALRRRGAVAVTEGERVVGLLRRGGEDPAPESDQRLLYAIGEPVQRGELRAALGDLRALVDLGLGRGLTGRIEMDEHLPELLLMRSPRLAGRLRRRALGPLDDYATKRRANLIETLQTFVACNFDRRESAARLQVHPNTLDYRLRRVEALTGLKLTRASDMVLICLALSVA
jgi:hypothetical protein